MALSESVKGLFKWPVLKSLRLVALDKVLHKWFTEVCPEGKHVTGLMITEKSKSLCDEMKVIEKCIFSEGWLRLIVWNIL